MSPECSVGRHLHQPPKVGCVDVAITTFRNMTRKRPTCPERAGGVDEDAPEIHHTLTFCCHICVEKGSRGPAHFQGTRVMIACTIIRQFKKTGIS